MDNWLELYLDAVKPDEIDILAMAEVLHAINTLIYPIRRPKQAVITLKISEGSTRLIAHTEDQHAISQTQTHLYMLQKYQDTRKVPDKFGNALKEIYRFCDTVNTAANVITSEAVPDEKPFHIRKGMPLFESEPTWFKTKLTLYGEIQSAGGVTEPNIHLKTRKYGTVIIHVPRSFLAKADKNLLYQKVAVEISAEQNSETGNIRDKSAVFLKFIDFNPNITEFKKDVHSGSNANSWHGEDSVAWVRELRGAL